MLTIKELNKKDFELCYALDSNTISLWSKKQWENELKKKGIKVYCLVCSNLVIGICVFQVVLDEAQINYFAINQKFQRQRFGTHLMNHLIKRCEKLKINKLFLEVSESNAAGCKFYTHFDFSTYGIRKNYYKDGSNALLKEKKLIKK